MSELTLPHHTKIVATIGPASMAPEIIRKMIQAGMSVARLNFSHGDYQQHAGVIANIRQIARELDSPITILQDLQGPKIRVGQLPGGRMELIAGKTIDLVPVQGYNSQADTVPIDYPDLAAEAVPCTPVLLDDGLLELVVEQVHSPTVRCRVVEGGILKNRKGVNLPSLNLTLPSMTAKDKQDLEFGISQQVDWVSLSFVRSAADIRYLKEFLAERHAAIPVIAKIEKPQALDHLEEILDETQGIMVARGDLGVEISPERVPMIQKHIIRACNRRSIPVITATQMLESMIHEPRPTRAEANDVANAILDGTDAVMLSGESAVGEYPVAAVRMMARIAREVEKDAEFPGVFACDSDHTSLLCDAAKTIERGLHPPSIAVFTQTGRTAGALSSKRPRALIVALTPSQRVYHSVNLFWGVIPVLLKVDADNFEQLLAIGRERLLERKLAAPGDQILIVAGVPTKGRANLLKMHTI